MEMVFILVLSGCLWLTSVQCESLNRDFDCQVGYWGTKCQHLCSKTCHYNTCHKTNGTCLHGCKKGYFGDKCESGCVNCRNGKCNRVTGSCSEGCSAGYYKDECSSRCNVECRHQVCDRRNGTCIFRCNDGYYGPQCEYKCPDDCCACENGTCLIDYCSRHICYIMTVTFGTVGTFVLVLVTTTVIYRYSKRKFKQEAVQTVPTDHPSRSLVEVPDSSRSHKIINHYDEINDEYYNGRSTISRSLDSLDVISVRKQFVPPDKCKYPLPRKKFRSTFSKRRAKSLSTSTDSLDAMPSCWVGTGQELFELFGTIPEGQHDSKNESQTEGGLEESVLAQIRASSPGTSGIMATGPLSDVFETDTEYQNDTLSVQSGKSATRKGYISAIFDKCEVDSLVPVVGTHEAIPE